MTEEELKALQEELAAKQKLIDDLTEETKTKDDELEKVKGDAGKFKRIADKYKDVDLEKFHNLEQQAEAFAGLSPEMIDQLKMLQKQAQSEKEKKILEEAGMDALFDHRMAGERQRWEEERKNLLTENEDLKGTLSERDRKDEINSFERRVGDSFLSHSKMYLEGVGDLATTYALQFSKLDDEGNRYFEIDGEPWRSEEDATKLGSVEEFISTKLPELRPSLLRKPQGTGAQGSGDTTVDLSDNPFATGNSTAQMTMRASDLPKALKLAKDAKAAGKLQLKVALDGFNA